MARVLFKDRLKAWRGSLSLKEAAALLNVDYPSYRKYETGKRTPCKLALAHIESTMQKTTTTVHVGPAGIRSLIIARRNILLKPT